MPKLLEAKVAEVLSPREVAINAGSTRGVQTGDEVQIRRLVIVRDPDTHEELGTVLVPSVQMVVSKVWEKMSVARVTQSVESDATDFASIGRRFMAPLKRVTAHEAEADSRTVLVSPGDRAEISLRPVEGP